MNNKIIIAIVLVVLFALLGLSIYKSRNDSKNVDEVLPVTNEVVRPTETINAKYQYKDGKNIFVISLELPTPCHATSQTVLKNNDVYEINLEVKPTQEICAQVITERLIKVQWSGQPNDTYIVKLNGEVVNLNIFTIPAKENIDDIQVYVKG